MNDLTFQQINVFLTVAKYNNLTEAAEQMFISQPALSRTLQRFEENIGFQAFARSNKGVKLTPEGEYLYSSLEPLISNLHVIMKTAKDISSRPKKRLHIVQYISYNAVEDFSIAKTIVNEYMRRYPDVSVTETLHDFRELRQQIEYGDADIAISQDFALAGIPNITRKVISRYNMYIAISNNHPLAAHDEISPELLRGETLFIVPRTGTSFDKEHAVMMYGQMGFTVGRIEFAPNFMSLLHTLRQEKGFSICGKFVHIGAHEIKYYPIPPKQNPSRVVAAWRTDRISPEARNLIAMLPAFTE